MGRPGAVVVVGVATRALAQSAARCGWRVTAVDGFGDLDLREIAEVHLPGATKTRRFSPRSAVSAASRLPPAPLVYGSNLENYPSLVARLAADRMVWGNGARTLAEVRNPVRVMRPLARAGCQVPEARLSAPATRAGRWLVKPLRSGGGLDVRPWQGERIPARVYLQEQIDGIPGSIVFAADGRDVAPLGLTQQLVGARSFGGHGFLYCGNILCPAGQGPWAERRTVDLAVELVGILTREFHLSGLNGLDVVVRDGVPVPIEVNPRYCASMELVERATGAGMFDVHRRCFEERRLPGPFDLAGVPVVGKAVLYARTTLRAPDLRRMMARRLVADVPDAGAPVERGAPVCTVFAEGGTVAGCRRKLAKRAAALYRRLGGAVGAGR